MDEPISAVSPSLLVDVKHFLSVEKGQEVLQSQRRQLLDIDVLKDSMPPGLTSSAMSTPNHEVRHLLSPDKHGDKESLVPSDTVMLRLPLCIL